LKMGAGLYIGQIEHRVDEISAAPRREMARPCVQGNLCGPIGMGRGSHVGRRDLVITVAEFDVVVLALVGHWSLPYWRPLNSRLAATGLG